VNEKCQKIMQGKKSFLFDFDLGAWHKIPMIPWQSEFILYSLFDLLFNKL
jgi:hypothetical protein